MSERISFFGKVIPKMPFDTHILLIVPNNRLLQSLIDFIEKNLRFREFIKYLSIDSTIGFV